MHAELCYFHSCHAKLAWKWFFCLGLNRESVCKCSVTHIQTNTVQLYLTRIYLDSIVTFHTTLTKTTTQPGP